MPIHTPDRTWVSGSTGLPTTRTLARWNLGLFILSHTKERWPARILLCHLLSTRIIARSNAIYAREMGKTGSYLKGVLSLSAETNMRPAPPTVSALDVTSTVMDLMAKENVGSIVVVENSQPVGTVTEKDTLYRVLKAGKNLELTLVKDAMSKPLVTIDAERTIADALEKPLRLRSLRFVSLELF